MAIRAPDGANKKYQNQERWNHMSFIVESKHYFGYFTGYNFAYAFDCIETKHWIKQRLRAVLSAGGTRLQRTTSLYLPTKEMYTSDLKQSGHWAITSVLNVWAKRLLSLKHVVLSRSLMWVDHCCPNWFLMIKLFAVQNETISFWQ